MMEAWSDYGVWQTPLRQRLRPQQSSLKLQFWLSCLQQKVPEPRSGTEAHNCVALQHCSRRTLSSQRSPSFWHRFLSGRRRRLFLRFLFLLCLRAASPSSSLRPMAPRSPSTEAAAPPIARPKRRLVHVSNCVSSNSALSGCVRAEPARQSEYVKSNATYMVMYLGCWRPGWRCGSCTRGQVGGAFSAWRHVSPAQSTRVASQAARSSTVVA